MIPRLQKRGIPGTADPTSRAVTTEWIVALLRPAYLGIFALIGWLKPPTQPVDLSLLGFLILAGALFAIYAFHLLASGRFARDLPRYLSFFIAGDILLLVALAYVANIFQEGLIFFYHLLIVVVALRASFRFSLLIAPIMTAAYYVTQLLLSGAESPPAGRFLLDAAGLSGVAIVCGWFAEHGSRGWELVGEMSRSLASASGDLDETRRELEVMRRTQEAQRDFFACVSHELRTPLTGIIGYSDLMLLGEVGPLDPRQRQFVQEIMGKGIGLLNLIDNILNIHKVQAGRWQLRLGPVSPERLVQEALATLGPDARRREVRVVLEQETPGAFPEMIADGEKVKLVLLNIIANALRYTRPGGAVRVGVDLVVDRTLEERFPHLISSADAVRISVADAGPGVPPEDRPHLFELFFRGRGLGADPSPSRMGLGLAVAREIIELHWGRIWFEETPGGGSTFRFTLPLRPLRAAARIALVTTTFNVETLLDGLVRQFEDELAKKRLTVRRAGWPAADGRPFMLAADRQLLQSVLYNVMNNNVRYAFPGSEIQVGLQRDAAPDRVVLRLANRGEVMAEGVVAQVNRGDEVEPGGAERDLRRVQVSLSLARDIIESHGGTFTLENLGNQGTAVTMGLPAG